MDLVSRSTPGYRFISGSLGSRALARLPLSYRIPASTPASTPTATRTALRRAHETTPQLRQGRPRRLRSHGCIGALPQGLRTRPASAHAGPVAGLADQRLRLLPRHALEGPGGGRREGAAVVLTGRLARMPVLHRPRTRR